MPDHHQRGSGKRGDRVEIAFEHGGRARDEKIARHSAADARHHSEQAPRSGDLVRRRGPFRCRQRQRKKAGRVEDEDCAARFEPASTRRR